MLRKRIRECFPRVTKVCPTQSLPSSALQWCTLHPFITFLTSSMYSRCNPCVPLSGKQQAGVLNYQPGNRWERASPSVACRSRPLGRAFWRRANTCNQWESAHLSLSRLVALTRIRTLAHTIPQESETWACVGSDKRTARRGKTSWKMKWPIHQTTYTLTRSPPSSAVLLSITPC